MRTETGASILAYAILAGALLGTFESLLVYETGYAPPMEVAAILSVDLALAVCAAILCAAALHLAGKDSLHGAQIGLLFLPVLVFTARGQVDPHQVAYPWATWLRAGFTVFGLGLVLWTGRPEGAAISARRFAVLSAALAMFGSVTFALRTIDHVAARDVYRRAPLGHVAAALLAVALLLLGYLVLFAPRNGHSRSAQSWALLGGGVYAVCVAASIAWAEGVRLPTFETHRSRGSAPAATGRSQSPNVILIVLDTVRRDRLSLYGAGRATSPFLESLASRSLVFDKAYAPSTYSLSSHASIFTGLPPSVHGAHPVDAPAPDAASRWILGNRFHAALRPGVRTIAQEWLAAGYHTAGITGNDVFLAEWTGLQRGFEDFASEAYRSYRYVPTAQPLLARLGFSEEYPYHRSWPADAIVRLAIQWISGVQGDNRPFFLFLNLFDAHQPYLPPPPYDEMFVPLGGRSKMTETAYELSQYDGAIAFMDGQIGRLVTFLRERGMLEHTLFVVTADHGEFFGEHGLQGHASALYDQVLRVPLLASLPGQRARVDVPSPVSLMRLPAIIRVAVTGQVSPGDLARSMASADPQIVSSIFVGRGQARPLFSRAVVDDRWKLIVHSDGKPELYDLQADPGENRDLWAQQPAAAASLIRDIERWEQVGAPRTADKAPEVPGDVLERLRSLGYLGN